VARLTEQGDGAKKGGKEVGKLRVDLKAEEPSVLNLKSNTYNWFNLDPRETRPFLRGKKNKVKNEKKRKRVTEIV